MATIEREADQEIGIRVSREQGEKLERAASARGQSLNDFAASALLRAAEEVLVSPSVTVMSERDFARFLALCDSDAPPAPALVRAAEEYKRRLADGSLQVED